LTTPHPSAVVAVVGTDEAITSVLRLLLRDAGLPTAVLPPGSRITAEAVIAFLARHDPAVVIYRVPPPYSENWAVLRDIHTHPIARRRPFVVLTTDPWMIEERAGRSDPFPVIGEPFDVEHLLAAVQDALARTARGGPPGGTAPAGRG
jgi:CheY-like chemotaxis protein